ncbi:hypothetical protein JAAARDRAFT_190593 [Jaapia argillacea MUCL 33604]|uniref:Protein kinase domain-containing protein n=1 Tax=Jaapia argillacea MUCL 33604 TaxID=933084 RepID=A0A067Q6V1_9AGAM|nr:hypothetical protein JAAARDRAFT_190593 [Jaapia argillacea MUCL 33604]
MNPLPLGGDDLPATPRKESDIYALAGTLAEVITSKVPHDFQVVASIARGVCPYTEKSFLKTDIPDW